MKCGLALNVGVFNCFDTLFFQPIRVGKSSREVCRFGLCFFSFLSLPELLSFLCSSYLFHSFGAILVDEGSGEKSK